ncbi:hypothetical protein DSCW_00850 [Desulfosarcina widdelii]|uniref:Uncharacterized protein n=1 Tax=Desulfosarcina widdelii TaxID=947919 RepID=A0A5K7YVJ1_9BACT|nr:hypothetical protein DSCW_00850 [Desulfosarcina widdelii]
MNLYHLKEDPAVGVSRRLGTARHLNLLLIKENSGLTLTTASANRKFLNPQTVRLRLCSITVPPDAKLFAMLRTMAAMLGLGVRKAPNEAMSRPNL